MSGLPPLVFLDDAVASAFEPFSVSRPLAEVRAGGLLVRERWQAVLRASTRPCHFVAGDWLQDFDEPGAATAAPAVLPAGTIVINSRALPVLPARDAAASPSVGVWQTSEGLAAVRLSRPTPRERIGDGLDALVADGAVGTSAVVTLEVHWLSAVWGLVSTLPRLLPGDIAWRAATDGLTALAPAAHGAYARGAHPVYAHPDARVEPGSFLDTTDGPILLNAHAVVHAFTRLVGPAWIGAHSTVTTDRVAVVSIGPWCKVHGEMSHTILTGYANKGHDGFVGHSVLGRWVNLGAGTITSNLKNTYGPVSLWTPRGVEETGEQFLGTFFGDHAKTGIGLRLTTGCVIGAGANCFDAMPPKRVPPFAWGNSAPYGAHALDKFLDTAARMMARRQQELGDAGRAHWRRVHAHATRTAG